MAEAPVAGPRAGRFIERLVTRGVRQRTIGVRAAGRFAGRQYSVRPVPARRGGVWQPPESEPPGVESLEACAVHGAQGRIVAAVGVGACATDADVYAMLFGCAEPAGGRG